MDVIKRKDPACFVNSDTVLRDQFIEFVRDGMLRRELRWQVRLDSTLSFLDARQEALRWMEEGENPYIQRPRAQSCSITTVTDLSAQSNAILSKPSDELTEVKESLRKQQAQLDTILKHLESSVPHAVSGSFLHQLLLFQGLGFVANIIAIIQMVDLYACVAINLVILQDFVKLNWVRHQG